MKLLLTSAGLSNKSIANALLKLTGKPFKKLKLAFIPTAANMEEGDKDWLIKDLYDCQKLGFSSVDIVDISALPEKIIKSRLEDADVLFFEGGDTVYLMDWIKKSGLQELLPKMLKTKIYVGVSAGSMVTTPNLVLSDSRKLYFGYIGKYKKMKGLGFVDFQVRPHLNSPHFPAVRIKVLEKLTKKISEPVYAIDDNTAIMVDGGKISVVSEGKWKKFN